METNKPTRDALRNAAAVARDAARELDNAADSLQDAELNAAINAPALAREAHWLARHAAARAITALAEASQAAELVDYPSPRSLQ